MARNYKSTTQQLILAFRLKKMKKNQTINPCISGHGLSRRQSSMEEELVKATASIRGHLKTGTETHIEDTCNSKQEETMKY